jgi:hypothetical protein
MVATSVAQTAAGVADGTGPLLQHVGGTTAVATSAGGSTVVGTAVAGSAGAGAKAVVGSKLAALAATGSAILGIALIGAACYVGYRVCKKLKKGTGAEEEAAEDAEGVGDTPGVAAATAASPKSAK